jgi:hypothetical protein
MIRWQRPLGISLLLAAAGVIALYEFSVLGTQPAVTVALLFAILGGIALGSARRLGSVSH